jgi:pimeloyl-ACP methyl ester carboxylesterase
MADAARVASKRPEVEQHSFISHDGTPIGYQLMGNPDGIPLLLANGLGATYSAYRFIIHRYWDTFRFICWDYRGMYTSGRPLSGYDGLSVEENARDGVMLLKEILGVDRCFALGWSKGVQVLMEMTRTVGDSFDGLILHNGVAGRPYETLAGVSHFREVTPRIIKELQRLDSMVTRTVHWAVDWKYLIPIFSRVGLVHHDLDRSVFHDIAGNFKHLDMHLYMEALLKIGEHDARDALKHVGCPTLIVASTHDRMTPLSVAEEMAREIPDCELEVIPGGTHYAAVEFPDLINRQLESWFARRFPDIDIEPN